jgi:pimeloyl-ACP methyl ester carboxylesterase
MRSMAQTRPTSAQRLRNVTDHGTPSRSAKRTGLARIFVLLGAARSILRLAVSFLPWICSSWPRPSWTFLAIAVLGTRVLSQEPAPSDPAAGIPSEVPDRPELDPVSARVLRPASAYELAPEHFGLVANRERFVNRSGHEIAAWWIDGKASERTILICPASLGNMSYLLPWCRLFVEAGYDVFVFDYQGFGLSAGPPSIGALLGDGLGAYDHVTTKLGRRPRDVGVFGASIGALVAVGIAARREVAALAVEDVSDPRARLAEIRASLPDDESTKQSLSLVESVIIPAIDPLEHGSRVTAPTLFIHGVDDWLVPAIETTRVVERWKGPHRVWFIEGAGHAPEPIDLTELEYANQLRGFFDEAFSSGTLETPSISYDVVERTEEHEATENAIPGKPVHVTATILSRPAATLEIVFMDSKGRFTFHRITSKQATTRLETDLELAPSKAFAIVRRHTRPADGETGVETWEDAPSELSKSLRRFHADVAELAKIPVLGVQRFEVPGFEGVVPRFDPSVVSWARGLPEPEGVHPRVRPQYARLFATVLAGVPTIDDDSRDFLARRIVASLPSEPDRHYDTKNGSMVVGFEDVLVAEVAYTLGRERYSAGSLEEAQRLLRIYIDVQPDDLPLRIERQEVEALGREKARR